MKGLFHKNLIYPTLRNGNNENVEDIENGSVKHQACIEVPIIIPIKNELESFERRLNNNELYSPGETGWSDLILRRHFRSPDAHYENETCKYEVLNNTAESLIHRISEKTEFFVKDTGCFFEPHCKEFIMSSVGSDDPGIKLIVEFDRTGFCNKITAIHHKRRMGSVLRKCSAIPNSYKYSVRNSHNQEIAAINSKYCFKSNVLCLRECRQFDIVVGKDRLPKGKIMRESIGFAMMFFHGDDAVIKLLLIVSLVLMDLQTSPARRKGLCQCDFLSCFLQFVASIAFYIVIFALIVLIFFVFIIR